MKWWLSYAGEGEEGNLGVSIVEIPDSCAGKTIDTHMGPRVDEGGFLHAVSAAKRAGISPGGEVRGFLLDPDAVETASLELNRLYTREELLALDAAERSVEQR